MSYKNDQNNNKKHKYFTVYGSVFLNHDAVNLETLMSGSLKYGDTFWPTFIQILSAVGLLFFFFNSTSTLLLNRSTSPLEDHPPQNFSASDVALTRKRLQINPNLVVVSLPEPEPPAETEAPEGQHAHVRGSGCGTGTRSRPPHASLR